MKHIPMPTIKTRAEASTDLLRHFRAEGWIAQPYPKGQMVRLMVSEDGGMIFSQSKEIHPKLSQNTSLVLRRVLRPLKGWNGFLCVREAQTGHLWIFDMIIEEGQTLDMLGAAARIKKLPRYFICPEATVALPLVTVEACHRHLTQGRNILFRHVTIPGWRPEAMALLTCPKA